MIREKRKDEHLKYALELETKFNSGLGDIHLIPDSLPDLAFDKIDVTARLGDFHLSTPLIINAITGGTTQAKKINSSLAEIAKHCELPLAVGSQTAALIRDDLRESFQVARKLNPQGLIFANVGAHVAVEQAQQAVEMLEADALQIHLNVPQELAMEEGDRNFQGYFENIQLIRQKLNVPIIVKEVGFGLAQETVKKLKEINITLLDVGGKGGTNFIAIEKSRQEEKLEEEIFLDWGLPTAISVVESVVALESQGQVIASGGLNNGLELAKAIALGAQCGAIAGPFLKILVNYGEKALINQIESIKNQLKMTMLMVGASNITQLQKKPLVILGTTAQWLTQRNIDINKYARR